MKKFPILLSTIAAIGFTSCAYLTAHQSQIQSAASTTATVLVASAKTYQALGEPGLPTQYKSLFDSLSSGASQLQTQLGQPANPAAINTGSPAVNAALVKNLTPGAIVTQGDVNTIDNAAALAAAQATRASVVPNAQ